MLFGAIAACFQSMEDGSWVFLLEVSVRVGLLASLCLWPWFMGHLGMFLAMAMNVKTFLVLPSLLFFKFATCCLEVDIFWAASLKGRCSWELRFLALACSCFACFWLVPSSRKPMA